MARAICVSNPHRYGQRPPGLAWGLIFCPLEFQTLIGTVKGLPGPGGTTRISRFQTLIGTVKGPMTARALLARLAFQTLIGTVKGGAIRPYSARAVTIVSNPHRYGQRRTPGQAPQGPVGRVSNPHRYGQRQLLVGTTPVWFGFQTLIGTVKGGPGEPG